jgi:hypothetical protein
MTGLRPPAQLLTLVLDQARAEYEAQMAALRGIYPADDEELAALEAELVQRLADIDLCRAWIQARLMDGRPAQQGSKGG